MENVVVARDGDGDEELSLFLEMRRREKVRTESSFLQGSGGNCVDKTSTTSCVELRKSAVEKFLDSENNKSDYEWLLAVPQTLNEMEAQGNTILNLKERKARSTALKPRVENIPQERVTRSVKASKPTPRLNSSTGISKQANAIAEPKPKSKPSRQATPTSRTTLTSSKQTNSAPNSNPGSKTSSIKSASTFTRSSSVGKSAPGAKSKSPTIPEKTARPASTSRSRPYGSGDKSTGRSKISNDVNPVLMGTQMVERVVNMRKLPPPKHDDNMSSGFGRTLSKSSLDMALRHMNIKCSIPKNLRVTINAPTNSMDGNESSPSSLYHQLSN